MANQHPASFLWVFGYGSLMWDGWESKFDCIESQRAELPAFARSFNKASEKNWGTRQVPGPTLGLVANPDGSCAGIAFCFSDKSRDKIESYLKEREGSAFKLEIKNVRLISGGIVPALVAINDTGHRTYVGNQSLSRRAALAKKAVGTSGKCVDYVQQIHAKLAGFGIKDESVDEFKALLFHRVNRLNLMSISERDLKVLWGRAAGRCSMCKIVVTADKESVNDSFPFGEAAHIVAEKPGGPRGDDGLSENLRNSYLNLILLCPNCHTKIDKGSEDFPVAKLLQFKAAHESEMAQLHRPDKESYDELLQFSRVTEENWLSPDRKDYMPIGVTKEQWIAPFLEPRLKTAVPLKVIRAFEVARGCMVYSWFLYPLAALGLQQVLRVGKLAVRERCLQLRKESDDFTAELKMLVSAKVLSSADESRWLALGRLCDDREFLAGATLFDPGQAISTLRLVTDLINGLF